MSTPEKKIYNVALPVTGVVYVRVEAADEDEAIDKALSVELADGEKELPAAPDEWQVHKEIVSGNIFHGDLNEAYAEEEG